MQKINVDLIRLAVSGAVMGAVMLAAEWEGFHHRDRLANSRLRITPPIHVKAILVPAPPTCWAANEPIGAAAKRQARTERGAIVQTCASVAPAPGRRREPLRRFAFAL